MEVLGPTLGVCGLDLEIPKGAGPGPLGSQNVIGNVIGDPLLVYFFRRRCPDVFAERRPDDSRIFVGPAGRPPARPPARPSDVYSAFTVFTASPMTHQCKKAP